jgi:tRNA G18 (ribose-2'-O)-methylase SpoU
MPEFIRLNDLDDPRVAAYRDVADALVLEARRLFVAEGRLVVRRLLARGGYRVQSLLLTDAARTGLGDVVDATSAGLPIYLVSSDAMRAITGFNLHRGCLALVERPAVLPLGALLHQVRRAGRLVVLEEVANADNVGSVFRNAAAFSAAGVLLSPGCCDPLYRKAIRTSMGAALGVPFARVAEWPDGLAAVRAAGFALVALTPAADARDIGAFARDPRRPSRVALLVGTEGAGVSPAAYAAADVRVRIPMAAGVDSLNLATATGIALQRLYETQAVE